MSSVFPKKIDFFFGTAYIFKKKVLSRRASVMEWIEKTKEAFAKAVEKEYNLNRYAEKIGISYSIVNRLRSGKTQFEKLDLSTFFRLFPEMRIYFFREEYPEKSNIKMNTIEVGGHVSGMILQNQKNTSSKSISLVNERSGETPGPGLDPVLLARNLRRDSRFSAEEKLKFLDFLDEQK